MKKITKQIILIAGLAIGGSALMIGGTYLGARYAKSVYEGSLEALRIADTNQNGKIEFNELEQMAVEMDVAKKGEFKPEQLDYLVQRFEDVEFSKIKAYVKKHGGKL